MTSLPNREETNQQPDANTTANKTKGPHSPLGEVSNKLDTTPDAREYTPSNVPSKYNTGMSVVVARDNPSHTNIISVTDVTRMSPKNTIGFIEGLFRQHKLQISY